jgi:4-nitrophenyl phosphatase
MDVRGAVIDVDGTVLRGDRTLPGATRGLEALASADVGRLFVTNNPTRVADAYADRFARAGVDVDPDEVLTAGTTTVSYLEANHAGEPLYVVGEPGLVEQLEAAAFRVVDDPAAAGVVVASIDREFGYDDLAAAMWALEDDDVAFVGTDPDMVIPAADRDVPGSGAVVHAIAGVAGREPDAMLGKPSETARRLVLDRLGLPATDCLVVGDRLDTDVAFGNRAGMTTALVLSGVTDEADLDDAPEEFQPDYVLETFGELESLLGAH